MMKKKILALTMALTMTAAAFAGCGNNGGSGAKTNGGAKSGSDNKENTAATENAGGEDAESSDISLKVWTPEEEQDVTKEMCDLFAEKHPEYNLTFDVSVMGVDDSIDAMKKDNTVAADVFLYPSGGIAELVEAGLIYPITVDADAVKSLHGEGAVKACTLGDELYGIPVTPNSWFMYYDSSKYTEDDVKSLDAMMAKDLGDDIYNFSCTISNSWYIEAFFYANGGTLYGENGDDPTACSWNDEKGLKAAQYVLNLANNPKYVEDSDGLAGSLASEGKLAAFCSGTWSAESAQEYYGENYAACKLPTINIDGTDYQLSNFADYKAYGVNSATAQPKAAQELAEWLGGEECQLLRFQKVNSTAPTIPALTENADVAANKAVAALVLQTNYSTPNPTTSQLNAYWDPAAAFGAGIINKDITEANLQESLDAMVEGFLATVTTE